MFGFRRHFKDNFNNFNVLYSWENWSKDKPKNSGLLCPWNCPGKNTEWIAISNSRDLSDPGIELASLCPLHWQADSLPLHHLGSPFRALSTFNIIRGQYRVPKAPQQWNPVCHTFLLNVFKVSWKKVPYSHESKTSLTGIHKACCLSWSDSRFFKIPWALKRKNKISSFLTG